MIPHKLKDGLRILGCWLLIGALSTGVARAIINGDELCKNCHKYHRYIGKIVATRADGNENKGTGFLVACRQVILTAGHNINERDPEKNSFYPADDENNEYKASITVRPNGYKPGTNTDLALIKLARRLPKCYGERTPKLSVTEQPDINKDYLLLGYGLEKVGGTYGTLRSGESRAKGTLDDNNATDDNDKKKMIFVVSHPDNKKIKITYEGDSGAPLVDKDIAAGVTAGGTYGLTFDPKLIYSAYASIWDNREWLQAQIRSLCGEAPPGIEEEFLTPDLLGSDPCGECTPRSCTPDDCGPVWDQCGNFLDCGECPEPPPPVCGDGICNGEELCLTCPEDCGRCPAPTCPNAIRSCGPEQCGLVADGCGGFVYCGACPSDECAPVSCGSRHGTIFDGCSGIKYCGWPDAYVANYGSGTVSVIRTQTNTVVATIPVGTRPARVAITPDGTRAYVTHRAQARPDRVSVIDTATNAVLTTIPVGDSPWGVAITPDGTRAYVANEGSNTVSVIDTQTNTVIATVAFEPRFVVNVAITPDGTRAYVTNAGARSVFVVDTKTNTVVASVPVGTDPIAVAITPDGERAYVTNQRSNTVSVIDTKTNTVVATIPVERDPEDVVINWNGTRVYVTNISSRTVSVINTQTNTVVATVTVVDGVNQLAITPDGTRVYVTGGRSVSVIDTVTNTVMATVPMAAASAGVAIIP